MGGGGHIFSGRGMPKGNRRSGGEARKTKGSMRVNGKTNPGRIWVGGGEGEGRVGRKVKGRTQWGGDPLFSIRGKGRGEQKLFGGGCKKHTGLSKSVTGGGEVGERGGAACAGISGGGGGTKGQWGRGYPGWCFWKKNARKRPGTTFKNAGRC